MKEILIERNFDIFQKNDTAEELADKTLSAFFGRNPNITDLPIDPFAIAVKAGAVYILLDTKEIEGFYILPSSTEKLGKIGIKADTLIERQRFSMAHELCHHLKDEENGESIQGDRNPVEVFANQFASSLLMPGKLLKKVVQEVGLKNQDNLDSILEISIKFGVSFNATFLKLNKLFGWRLKPEEIAKRSRKYKPQKRKPKLYEYDLYKQIILNYQFINFEPPKKLKNRFLRKLLLNDHQIENGKLSNERISEIIALLRIKSPQEIVEEHDLTPDECQLVGQYLMYEYIFSTKYCHEFKELKRIHSRFCGCSKYPQFGGEFRTVTAYIKGSDVRTTDPNLIGIELIELFSNNQFKTDLTVPEYIKVCSSIHHGITKIHPFNDGNGRSSRGLMNLQLLDRNITPFLISYEEKDKKEYYKSLQVLDGSGDSKMLELYVYKNIIENYRDLISNTNV